MLLYSLANKRVDFRMHDPNLNPLPSLLGARPRKDDLQRFHRASHRKATLSKRAAFESPHRWQKHQRGEGRSHFGGIAPSLPAQNLATNMSDLSSACDAGVATTTTTCASPGVNKVTPEVARSGITKRNQEELHFEILCQTF